MCTSKREFSSAETDGSGLGRQHCVFSAKWFSIRRRISANFYPTQIICEVSSLATPGDFTFAGSESDFTSSLLRNGRRGEGGRFNRDGMT